MICRSLEKVVKLEFNEGAAQESRCLELEYYLVESEEQELEGFVGEKVYGIEIVKRSKKSEPEMKRIRNYSFNKKNTREIVMRLAENTVTPSELPFILDDLLGA